MCYPLTKENNNNMSDIDNSDYTILHVETRVDELMQEGTNSPIRGWSASKIREVIASEFDDGASDYAWAYIKNLYGHGDK